MNIVYIQIKSRKCFLRSTLAVIVLFITVIIHNAVGVFQEWANENLPKLVESWINDLNTLDNEMEKE